MPFGFGYSLNLSNTSLIRCGSILSFGFFFDFSRCNSRLAFLGCHTPFLAWHSLFLSLFSSAFSGVVSFGVGALMPCFLLCSPAQLYRVLTLIFHR
jgi:hypothetical protein